MMIKVKSQRGVKFAIELITKLLDGYTRLDDAKPFEIKLDNLSDAELLNAGLAKIVKRSY